MAGFTTPALAALSTINGISRAVGSVRSAVSGDPADAAQRERAQRLSDLADFRDATEFNQLRASQDLAAAQARANRQDDADALALTARTRERQRLSALRRGVASQRARLGSQGISAADGSGEAILLGLINESDADRTDADQRDRMRLAALGREADTEQQRNLLEINRLRERQRIDRLARGG